MSKYRMPFWTELRWLVASWLFELVYRLTYREASLPMIEALGALAANFENDNKFNTVRMRRTT